MLEEADAIIAKISLNRFLDRPKDWYQTWEGFSQEEKDEYNVEAIKSYNKSLEVLGITYKELNMHQSN